jgi:hypothetical protein
MHVGKVECMQSYGGKVKGEIRIRRKGNVLDDDIKTDLREGGLDGISWIALAEGLIFFLILQ